MLFYGLPSTSRNTIGMEDWTLSNFDHEITDFTMNPSQDLLVTVHIPQYAHFFSLMLLELGVLD
jgi:hypothetical protein